MFYMSLKVTVEGQVESTKDVERLVDEEIAEFDHFFQEIGNDPVVRSERAIIKTYLAYKLGLVKKA